MNLGHLRLLPFCLHNPLDRLQTGLRSRRIAPLVSEVRYRFRCVQSRARDVRYSSVGG